LFASTQDGAAREQQKQCGKTDEKTHRIRGFLRARVIVLRKTAERMPGQQEILVQHGKQARQCKADDPKGMERLAHLIMVVAVMVVLGKGTSNLHLRLGLLRRDRENDWRHEKEEREGLHHIGGASVRFWWQMRRRGVRKCCSSATSATRPSQRRGAALQSGA
jgi:hypothetical protein